MRAPAACALLLGLLATAPLAGQDPPRAVPLLDLDEVDPEEGGDPVEVPEEALPPEVAARSISASGQFIVRGGTEGQRASVAIEADAVRGEVLQLFGENEPPVSVPIEVILHGQVGDDPRKRPLAYELRYTSEHFLLVIHVDLARGIDRDRMERAVLTGLLYERGLRDIEPGPLDAPVQVPAWLVEGLREAIEWRAGRGDRKLYEGVFGQAELFSIDELLHTTSADYDALDGASRAVFRVLSGGLVMALLEQAGGREGLRGFSAEVARFDGDLAILLRQHFPELNLSEKSLIKWWSLTLASLADAPVTEVMGVTATERALAEALVLHARDESGVIQRGTLEQRAELGELAPAERAMAARPAQAALTRLSYRCFPSYRPLIVDYQTALGQWIVGEEEELDLRLAELDGIRERMLERATRGRDYLDYMEIAGASEVSGSFDDYLDLKSEIEERPRVERQDPLTRYLDTLERVFRNRSGR